MDNLSNKNLNSLTRNRLSMMLNIIKTKSLDAILLIICIYYHYCVN